MRIGELIIEQGLASEADIERALEHQATYGGRHGENLVELGIVPEQQLNDLFEYTPKPPRTLEDTGLCLGETLSRAIGDKSGLTRVGWARVPMDEALSEVAIDISGRPYLVYHDQILPDTIFNQEKDLWREFFKSLAFRAGINLHINFCYGRNGHHLIESACKGVGLSLRQALAPDRSGILSTKGSLD